MMTCRIFPTPTFNPKMLILKLTVLSYNQGARKLMGENLKVVWAEFSTLS
jgi:hypothetical protein